MRLLEHLNKENPPVYNGRPVMQISLNGETCQYLCRGEVVHTLRLAEWEFNEWFKNMGREYWREVSQDPDLTLDEGL